MLGVVRGACDATTVTSLTAHNDVANAQAVRVSSRGRVLILLPTGEIDPYAIPTGTDLGKPIQQTTLRTPPRSTLIAFALSQDGNNVWVAPYLENSSLNTPIRAAENP